jgi:periplasmic divalent cation tolerance protein
MTDKVVALTTAGSMEEARRIAHHLVETRVAACVTFAPGVTSVYRWKGAVEEAGEVLLVIKSRRDLFARLEAELRRVHSYEVPELILLPVVEGAAPYLDWLDGEMGPAS